MLFLFALYRNYFVLLRKKAVIQMTAFLTE